MNEWVELMLRELDELRRPSGHIGLVRRYLRGEHDIPYMPKDADGEFTALARQSITNFLPLITGTFGRHLYVDGYRSGRSADNAEAWEVWTANRMQARQSITMQGAIDYGTSYVIVEREKIRPLNPRKSLAWYEDHDAEFPLAALAETGVRYDQNGNVWVRYEFWHGGEVYFFERASGRRLGSADDPGRPHDGDEPEFGKLVEVGDPRQHGESFVPWVRFRDRLDDEAQGVVRPLIDAQNRVNASVFYLLMALHYASFRQRWVTGIKIPRDNQEFLPDGKPNPNFGRPIEAFKTAVHRLWISEQPEAKFGDFDQTNVDGHLAAIENAVSTLLTLGRSSPLLAAGNKISNIAVESVAALNASMNSQIEQFQSLFTPSWDTVFELTGRGTPGATVRWRDNEPRSFAQVIDGLLKLNQIGAPARGLFEMVPGITDVQLEQWNRLKDAEERNDRVLYDAIAAAREAGSDPTDPTPEAE